MVYQAPAPIARTTVAAVKPTWRVARNDIGCTAGGAVLEAGADDVAGVGGGLRRGRHLRAVARNIAV